MENGEIEIGLLSYEQVDKLIHKIEGFNCKDKTPLYSCGWDKGGPLIDKYSVSIMILKDKEGIVLGTAARIDGMPENYWVRGTRTLDAVTRAIIVMWKRGEYVTRKDLEDLNCEHEDKSETEGKSE